MTREEAIRFVKWIRHQKPYSGDRIHVQQAIDIAISALEKEIDAEREEYKMTIEEAIFCMTTYHPSGDPSIYDCPKCKYYGNGCKSGEAHELAIKALKKLLKGEEK